MTLRFASYDGPFGRGNAEILGGWQGGPWARRVVDLGRDFGRMGPWVSLTLRSCLFARPYLRSRGFALPHSAFVQPLRNRLQYLARIATVIQICSER